MGQLEGVWEADSRSMMCKVVHAGQHRRLEAARHSGEHVQVIMPCCTAVFSHSFCSDFQLSIGIYSLDVQSLSLPIVTEWSCWKALLGLLLDRSWSRQDPSLGLLADGHSPGLHIHLPSWSVLLKIISILALSLHHGGKIDAVICYVHVYPGAI